LSINADRASPATPSPAPAPTVAAPLAAPDNDEDALMLSKTSRTRPRTASSSAEIAASCSRCFTFHSGSARGARIARRPRIDAPRARDTAHDRCVAVVAVVDIARIVVAVVDMARENSDVIKWIGF
jgi:hypothetical protein